MRCCSVGPVSSLHLAGNLFPKITASVVGAVRSLSDSGDNAEAGDGCSSAEMRSVAAANAASVEDAVGITRREVNQASVSATRSILVDAT